MKKQILLYVLSLVVTALSAQVFIENFETAATGGNLEGYNSWYVCFKAADALGVSPKIDEDALFYTGYTGSSKGKVAVLDSLVGKTSDSQRISTKIISIDDKILVPKVGQKMYAAFLVQVKEGTNINYRDFFTWEGSATSSFTRGRVFAKGIGTTDLQFAVSKNSSTSGQYIESQVISGGMNTNHLLVLCYEVKSGASNDVISLYINPDLTKTEAEQQTVLIATDVQSDYTDDEVVAADPSKTQTQMKINLRQRGVGALVGGIRVGTSWDLVLKGGGTNINQLSSETTSIYAYGKSIITSSVGKVEVFNITGKKVLSSVSNGRIETTLKSGLYIVRFDDNTGNIVSSKINIK